MESLRKYVENVMHDYCESNDFDKGAKFALANVLNFMVFAGTVKNVEKLLKMRIKYLTNSGLPKDLDWVEGELDAIDRVLKYIACC